jgi:para-nitrobenzyl esterase
MILNTPIGKFTAREINTATKKVYRMVSIPYARAGRFELPQRIDFYPDDAPVNSDSSYCFPQRRIPKFANLFLKHHMMRPEWLTEKDIQTEDAFVLNLWTSGLDEMKPVLVYIHGGGDYGSGTSPIYDGTHLAEYGIVVVTITYRVGLFGYMPVYEDDKLICNRAAFDQQAALQWVKRNIMNFGGDKNNITLMGQSGGSLSALNQFLNPVSSQLINKLILCGGPLPTAIPKSETRNAFEQALKMNGLKDIAGLKALPPHKILKLKAKNTMNDIIDGVFFPADPRERLKHGEFPAIPVLVGSNGDEFSMIEMPLFYKPMGIATKKKNLNRTLSGKYGEYADSLAKELQPDARDVVDLQIKIMELAIFHSASLNLMRALRKNCPVYGYRFNYVPNLYNGLRGSYHGAEIAMFFNNLDKMNIRITEKNRVEVEIIQRDWLSFVKTGKIPNRPLFNENSKITVYDEQIETMPFPHANLIEQLNHTDIYKKLFGEYLKNR